MNYLAHAFLSFDDPGILAGNMISDFVKGKTQFEYPDQIFKGIKLHRAIDEFTDTHPATSLIKSVFKQDYRLYAGAFADVAYDHFLANDVNHFESPEALMEFTNRTYQYLESHRALLPVPFQQMMNPMKEQNWLYHYRYDWGIEKSFQGLVRRARYLEESDRAFASFLQQKSFIEDAYAQFFPELKSFAHHTLNQLIKAD